MSEYYLYKYVVDDEIIYIGKSKNIHQRIAQHNSGTGLDEKFKPYLKDCKIFVAECVNSVEMDLLEKALINQYKPKLNVADKFFGFSNNIMIKDLTWSLYEKHVRKEIPQRNYKINKKKITFESFSKELANKRCVDMYKYIRHSIAKGYYRQIGDDEFFWFNDGDYLLITPARKEKEDAQITFYFDDPIKGGMNLPISIITDLDYKTIGYIVSKDFLKLPIVKEFEKVARKYF